jgi:hypothetical protein
MRVLVRSQMLEWVIADILGIRPFRAVTARSDHYRSHGEWMMNEYMSSAMGELKKPQSPLRMMIT